MDLSMFRRKHCLTPKAIAVMDYVRRSYSGELSKMRKDSPTTVATQFYHEIQTFFDCGSSLESVEDNEDDESSQGSREKEYRDELSENFPDEFQVSLKWNHIVGVSVSNVKVESEEDVSRVMACRCINIRGSIAHGKRPGLMYEAQDVTHCNVEEIFNTFGEGIRTFETVRAIKRELLSRGPVVSTSFKLTKGFAQKNELSTSYLMSQIGETHPVLITGWKLTEFGEVWIVNNLDSKDHIIAFGHFDIDKLCMAPRSTFENTPWQVGPYFDHDFSRVAGDWRNWPNLKMYLKSPDLERLAKCFESGFVHAVAAESPFELCDKTKRAHSRTCCLKEIAWDGERGKWRVTAGFID